MEVSRLIVGLKSDDESLRSDYSDKIVKMGEPAIEPLINTMNNVLRMIISFVRCLIKNRHTRFPIFFIILHVFN